MFSARFRLSALVERTGGVHDKESSYNQTLSATNKQLTTVALKNDDDNEAPTKSPRIMFCQDSWWLNITN
jgi:hypothetical protein